MVIQLALLERDPMYTLRLKKAFGKRYSENIKIKIFRDISEVIKNIEETDILLLESAIEIDDLSPFEHCEIAYLVDDMEVDEIRGIKAIGKYQKVEFIYKKILGIYSKYELDMEEVEKELQTKIISFVSASGGMGTTTVSVGAAKFFANMGKKVLYFSFDQFNNMNFFFEGKGEGELSDVIYAIKDNKTDLKTKIMSSVKTDKDGISYFDSGKTVLDICSTSENEFKVLFTALCDLKVYDYIIIDQSFSLNPNFLQLLMLSEAVVTITDGSAMGSEKIEKAFAILQIVEEEKRISLTDKICILYNKCDREYIEQTSNFKIKSIGRISYFQNQTEKEIAEHIGNMNICSNLFIQ